jgi:death on curing protein
MIPIFLTLDEIMLLHQRLVDAFGGSPEIRDRGLLQSALSMPSAAFAGQFLHTSLAEMGAAYLFHLVMNHLFVDGNKRTGAAAARIFLKMNGANFDPDETEYGDLVLAVASGKLDKADVIAFFKRHTRLTSKRTNSSKKP